MRRVLDCCLAVLLLAGCHKEKQEPAYESCNIQQVYADNVKKVTITNGLWGTVSLLEGDCMPMVPACNSCCRNCPVQRTVKIYQYTTLNDAVTSDPYKRVFDSFTTQLVAEANPDENGFFQVDIPAGNYSIVVVEDGKLYCITRDAQGGINPIAFNGGVEMANIIIAKATF